MNCAFLVISAPLFIKVPNGAKRGFRRKKTNFLKGASCENLAIAMADEIILDRETFKALAADSRVAILKKLSKRRMTGTELAEDTGLGPSTIKEHLDNLERVGLVAKSQDGVERKWKYYELTQKGRRIVEPGGVPAQVWLVLGLFAIGLVFVFQALNPQAAFGVQSAQAPQLRSGNAEDFGAGAAGIPLAMPTAEPFAAPMLGKSAASDAAGSPNFGIAQERAALPLNAAAPNETNETNSTA